MSSTGVIEVKQVPLIECLTHARGLLGQVRVIGLNVGSDGRAINKIPYRGGAVLRSLDLTPKVDPTELVHDGLRGYDPWVSGGRPS